MPRNISEEQYLLNFIDLAVDEAKRKLSNAEKKIEDTIIAVEERKRNKAKHYLEEVERLGKDLQRSFDYVDELLRSIDYYDPLDLYETQSVFFAFTLPEVRRQVDLLEVTLMVDYLNSLDNR